MRRRRLFFLEQKVGSMRLSFPAAVSSSPAAQLLSFFAYLHPLLRDISLD